jgi:hypothetical protein
MLKTNSNTIKSNSQDATISGAVKVTAGSMVIDNQWISYDNYIFRIKEYIQKTGTAYRPTFFKNRSYAVRLILALNIKEGIKVLESTQVQYTTREAVPLPEAIDDIPLVGIVLRQDGTNDLNMGFIPVTDKDLSFFSGTGNIIDKNLVGITGMEGMYQGLTGMQGDQGATGSIGDKGFLGTEGATGLDGEDIQGATGLRGMTGISWDTHLPFSVINQ